MASNWGLILRSVGFWVVAFLSSSSAYVLLRIIYPRRMIYESGGGQTYYDIPNLLVTDLTFIGIALMLAYANLWMNIAALNRLRPARRIFVAVVRAATLLLSIICIIHYVALHYEINIIPRSIEVQKLPPSQLQNFLLNNAADILDRKWGIFWSVIGVCVGTFLGSVSVFPFVSRRGPQ
jgi:hypothetical protein